MTKPTPKRAERPTSPHLQIYKLPLNARLSIMTRAVGVGLSIGLTLVLLWFSAVFWIPDLYEPTMVFLHNPFVAYGLLAVCAAVFFYLLNGVRHVLWDMVIGVNVPAANATGIAGLILTVLLTALLWWFAQNGHAMSADPAILPSVQ